MVLERANGHYRASLPYGIYLGHPPRMNQIRNRQGKTLPHLWRRKILHGFVRPKTEAQGLQPSARTRSRIHQNHSMPPPCACQAWLKLANFQRAPRQKVVSNESLSEVPSKLIDSNVEVPLTWLHFEIRSTWTDLRHVFSRN